MAGFFSNEDYDDMEFDPGMFYFRQYVMMRNESIFSTVERSDLEAVRRAIESGGNVNAVQEHDGCLLEAAVTRHDGAYEVIKLLLSKGSKDIPTRFWVCGRQVCPHGPC